MKYLLLLIAVAGLLGCNSSTDIQSSPCIALQLDCLIDENILIVGNSADASALLRTVQSASKKFEDTFGVSAGKTVIVPGGKISADQNAEFEKAGYLLSLPWISAADKARLTESSIRRQIEEQTKDLPENVRKAALTKALSAIQSKDPAEADDGTQAGALAHELGHLWFIEAFKPADAKAQKGHAYGGWAPDWLDETAAILMENSVLIESRKKAFNEMPDDDLFPLETFLSMEHPAAQNAKRVTQQFTGSLNQGESRAMVLTGAEAEAFLKASGGSKAANFYSQAQAFSDFMLSYSGETSLYPSLANALIAGGTFETWLSSDGSDWGLPSSLKQLDQDWQNWIRQQR